MANKFKDVFSQKKPDYDLTLTFVDSEASSKFRASLEQSYQDGQPFEANGIAAISTYQKDSNHKYPIDHQENITKLMVSPTKTEFDFDIEIESKSQTIKLFRMFLKDSVILETREDALVYIKIDIPYTTNKLTFTYKINLDKFQSVSDVVHGYAEGIGIIKKFFHTPTDQQPIETNKDIISVVKMLNAQYTFYKKLSKLETILTYSFDLSNTDNLDDTVLDVNELFQLLIEKQPVRLPRKLTASEETAIAIPAEHDNLKIGSSLQVSFQNENTYNVYNHKIRLYTANLLTNAVVKKLVPNTDGTMKVIYGDSDSAPMYISYTGFLTIDEAKTELKDLMSKSEQYVKALSVYDLMQKDEDII